jgi:hypothetical protein
MKRYALYLYAFALTFLYSCEKTSTEEGSIQTENPAKVFVGTFTFKGISYSGDCSVIPEDFTKVGFQWFMSIYDNSKDASLSMGLFPQNESNEFGISWNNDKGYGRHGVINLGKGQMFSIKTGKITKLSKTKFKMEGFAFADLSTIPIPFKAEGVILDLTDQFTLPSRNPYPVGQGSVSFYTNKPLNGEVLNISVWNQARTNFIAYGGTLTYHFTMVPICGQSESFYFQQPGAYKYEVTGNAGTLLAQGNFTVVENACNMVLINR